MLPDVILVVGLVLAALALAAAGTLFAGQRRGGSSRSAETSVEVADAGPDEADPETHADATTHIPQQPATGPEQRGVLVESVMIGRVVKLGGNEVIVCADPDHTNQAVANLVRDAAMRVGETDQPG